MKRASVIALLAMAALTPPSAVSAQSARYIDPSNGWAEVFDPDRAQGRRYVWAGLNHLIGALGRNDPVLDNRRDVRLDHALLRFRRAERALGDEPEVLYYIAYALSRWRRVGADGAPEDRSDEAEVAWRRLRQLDPEFLPDRVAYELAMIHMRRQELREARAEYERALDTLVPQPVVPSFLYFAGLPPPQDDVLYELFTPVNEPHLRGNLAEVAMLVGDLPAAIAHYDATIEQTQSPLTRTLALWGRALALKRSGDHTAALTSASRAIREDPLRDHPNFTDLTRRHGSFAVLHHPGVFFEPECEIHAYEAIGHEAAAVEEDPDRPDPRALRRALRSWRLFLSEGGAATRFADQARQDVERLEGLTNAR